MYTRTYRLSAVGSCLLWCICLLGSSTFAQAQGTVIKTIEKTFSGKNTIEVNHRYGPLVVLPATNNEVRVISKLYATSDRSEDIDALKAKHELKASESGNSLNLTTGFEVKNWNSNNGNMDLTFADGVRIKKIRDVKVEVTVYVPANSNLTVANRYDEIQVPEGVNGNLSLTIYSGRIQVGAVKGRLQLDAKYSKGEIGDFQNGELKIYDSDLRLGNGQDVELSSKYSNLKMGSFASMNADTYDDDITWRTVKGALVLKDKYSNFQIGRFNTARLDIYDCEFESEGGNEMIIKSKYSGLEMREVGQLSFESSFDDDVDIERVGSLSANSKYSNFRIGLLRSKLFLRSYDDEVDIREMAGPLEGIDFEGKYTDLSVRLPDQSAYQLDVNLTYGKIDYPEDLLEPHYYKEKNDRLELKGSTKGATESSPKITIVSHDGKITIQ